MRPHVPFLDTKAMDWQPCEVPGLFTKMLSRDAETGARTALQRVSIADGYTPPPMAHYHYFDEELLIVGGELSFDSKTWLGRLSYCYHPAETVHGFNSAVRGEATFISRVSDDLDFHFEDNPKQLTPYSRAAQPPEREIAIVADPRPNPWAEVRDHDGNVVLSRQVLSRHPGTGEGSMLVRFAPGWQSPHGPHRHTVYEEVFVLEGALELPDGTVYGEGAYMFKPPGTVQEGARAPGGALAYISFGGALDFVPAG
jgi:quercetin dioxygenase-like cupin family protein